MEKGFSNLTIPVGTPTILQSLLQPLLQPYYYSLSSFTCSIATASNGTAGVLASVSFTDVQIQVPPIFFFCSLLLMFSIVHDVQ